VLDGLAGLSRSQVLACCALTHRMLHAPAVIRVSILVQGGASGAARRCPMQPVRKVVLPGQRLFLSLGAGRMR